MTELDALREVYINEVARLIRFNLTLGRNQLTWNAVVLWASLHRVDDVHFKQAAQHIGEMIEAAKQEMPTLGGVC